MKIRKKITILASVLLLLGIAALAVAKTPSLRLWVGLAPATVQEENPADKKDPIQEALLEELSGLLKRYDTTNSNYYLAGTLSAIDRADSIHAMNDLTYKMGKWDHDLYVMTGPTELINDTVHYLYVDHAVKKILLAPAKKYYQQPGLPLDELYKHIRSEGFTVEKKPESGTMLNIGIVSPTHISMKGMSVSYDSVTRDVKTIRLRQAEVSDHMNEHKEKWITLKIKEWNDEPERKNYPEIGKFIERRNGRWQCTAPYNGYELIDQSIQ